MAMFNFLKKKKRPEEIGMPESSTVSHAPLFTSYCLRPVPYDNSDNIDNEYNDLVSREKERLQSISHADHLCHDMRSPGIKANSKLKIARLKRQNTNHLFTINEILAENEGEYALGAAMEQLILDEIRQYDEEIERIYKILSNSN